MNDLSPLDTSWILLCAFLVMTMQVGFCMLEIGLVRQKNSINVAYKKLMDFIVSVLVFWAVGYGIMYGAGHASGLFGTNLFFKSHEDGSGAFFVYQIVFCSAAAAIVGGALAERTHLSAYLIISALVAAVFYPLVGHWIWGGALDNGTPGWLAARGFVDFAGSTVVHGTGGWLALAAVMIVGPRTGRFDSDRPLRGSNYPLAIVGVLVLWFGWFGFNGGGGAGNDNEVIPRILINTSLSAAAGGFTLLSWAWLRDKKPGIPDSLNGTIAGLVGVTAGCNIYAATDAAVVGVFCATACGVATQYLERLRIDDVVGAWPAHAVAGAVGTLLVAVLGDTSAFPLDHSRIDQFVVQALGVATVALWAFGGGYSVLFVLNKLIPMRVSAADELMGLNIAEHDASTDLVELMFEMNAQRAKGDFESPVHVEPHTEVGQIATEYNRVLGRVRLEIETREAAYKQLEEASEFRFIFENTHEGIVQFARNGLITKANPAALALLGFTSEKELITHGGYWFTKLDGINREEHISMLRILKERGQSRDIEMSFTRRMDGRQAQLQLDLQTVAGPDGAQITVLGSLIDISERKANDRLRVERDSATAASRAKSEFLANMSHEIRTPLNGVTGMLELLSRTELNSRQSRFVGIAGNSADALLSVIDDILDVSKIEAGKLELESVPFPLPELLADVVDMFAPQAATKNIELASLVPTNLSNRVLGDPERLRQVLVNLLGNALKFTDRGTVILRCRATQLSATEASIRIDVEDSGPGISPEGIDDLFEPFTQADTSATRKHGGTGLGLNITRQLVNLMGGSIGVDSDLGRGTTFQVDLKLPLVEPLENETKTATLEPGNAVRKKIRVLAVDDHPINLELMQGLLTAEGFEVTSVDGAAPALIELNTASKEGRPYGLALLDYQMPETDGGELARVIRADKRFEQLRMIMLTSIDQALSAEERSALSIHACITKPLRRSRLFDAIDEALGVEPGDRAPSFVVTLNDPTATGVTSATQQTDQAPYRAQEQAATLVRAIQHPTPDENKQRKEAPSMTVLVVEDNPVNQMVLQELMIAAGHTVVVAENGMEALKCMEAGNIELVLMDCQMPVMDGFETTIKIRQMEAENGTPRLPIIAVTANAIKGDRERCLNAGMDDHITKPIDSKRLYDAISRHTQAES